MSVVARVKEMNEVGTKLGQEIVAPMVAKGFKDLTEEETNIVLTFLRASVTITKTMIQWAQGTRSYEDWDLMYRTINSDESLWELDKTGQLEKLAKEMMALDLREYFDAEVANLEFNLFEANLTISMTEAIIKTIEEGNLPEAVK